MGLLNRYQKTGGFLQLVKLLETCNSEKQHKLLETVREENPTWATEVENKILSVDKIFSWDDEVILDLITQLQDLTLATTLQGLDESSKERVFNLMGHSKNRKITDLMGIKAPSTGELNTANFKTIEEVRDLISKGFINLKKVDSSLYIEEGIEDKLNKVRHKKHPVKTVSTTPKVHETPSDKIETNDPVSSDHFRQIIALKKEVEELRAENSQLKGIVKTLSSKISGSKKTHVA